MVHEKEVCVDLIKEHVYLCYKELFCIGVTQ